MHTYTEVRVIFRVKIINLPLLICGKPRFNVLRLHKNQEKISTFVGRLGEKTGQGRLEKVSELC